MCTLTDMFQPYRAIKYIGIICQYSNRIMSCFYDQTIAMLIVVTVTFTAIIVELYSGCCYVCICPSERITAPIRRHIHNSLTEENSIFVVVVVPHAKPITCPASCAYAASPQPCRSSYSKTHRPFTTTKTIAW